MLSRWVDGFDCMLERMVTPPIVVLATEIVTSDGTTTNRADRHGDAHFESVISHWINHPESIPKQMALPPTAVLATERPTSSMLPLDGLIALEARQGS